MNQRLILKNAMILDVLTGESREGSVTIAGDRIEALDTRPPGEEIDLEGCFLIPGLISCHTHLSIVFPFSALDQNESPAITALRCHKRGMDALRAGVTTVRTVGELHRADISLRTMIAKGWCQGPRIFSAGRSISTTGGHGCGFSSVLADGADEFLKASRQELSLGANHVKVFITGGIAHEAEGFEDPQMTRAEMEAAVAAARGMGTYVCAHAGAPEPIQMALEAGIHCFEHGYYLDRETAGKMHAKRAVLVPTLGVTRSRDWMRSQGFAEWTIEKATAAAGDHFDSIRNAVHEGVSLVNGTDIPPGDRDNGASVVVREAEHMVSAGQSPLQALQSLTSEPAHLLGAAHELGRIAPGYLADFIAVSSDPSKDISALRELRFVVKGGEVIVAGGAG